MNNSEAKNLLSLQLVAGIVIFVIMTLVLREIAQDIFNKKHVTVADAQLSAWLHSQASPLLTRAMFVVTSLGSSLLVTSISIAFGLYLLWQRRFFWIGAVGACVGGGALLNRLLKYAFQRPRPYFDDPILRLDSYSFPSGHTMAATALYGLIAVYLLARTRDWRWRVLIILVASLLIGLVGFSRIYLGAHYLSDVLGAIAEGLAWLSLCLTLLQFIRLSIRRRHGRLKKAG